MSGAAASKVIYAALGDGSCIRLVDAPGSVLDQVRQELGAVEGPPAEPLLTVRFIDAVPNRHELRTLGVTGQPFAFDERRFYLVGDGGYLTHVDFGSLDTTEIEIERGAAAIPLLVPILALRLLDRDRVLLHAASFVYRGGAIVVTGWQSGGKSEVMLAFMSEQARYVADEWAIIDAGGRVSGLSSHVHLWDWQLRQLPTLWARLAASERQRLGVLRLARRGARLISRASTGSATAARTVSQLRRWIENAARARVPPERLFGAPAHRGSLDIAHVLLATVRSGATEVLPSESRVIAARMAASLEYERKDLIAAYAQYRYAFPDERSDSIEQAAGRERQILEEALSGVPAHEILHPYPPFLPDLYRAAVRVI